MQQQTLERRLELLKDEGYGYFRKEIVERLSVKYGCAKSTIYHDFATKRLWQPLVMEVKNALRTIVNRHEQLYRKAALTYMQAEINAQYGKVADSTEKVDASTKKASMSLTQQVGAFNTLALSGVTLALSFDRVEKAQLASDKANLNVQRSAERLDQAQKDLTESTMKYGAGSEQARDAQDKLRIAEETHNVSIERQKIVSDDLNQTYMQTALSIIPAVIGVVTSLSAVKGIIAGATQAEAVAEGVGAAAKTAALGPTGALTGATWGLNSALLANPIVWVVAAIAALVAALILAYNYCEPFKNAVDALGAAIGQGLSQALAVVKGALEWLWKNIFEPFVAFLSAGAMVAINAIIGALKWLGDVLKPVGDAFNWLAGVVGGAIDAVGKEMQKGSRPHRSYG